jgi:hypothetical protein
VVTCEAGFWSDQPGKCAPGQCPATYDDVPKNMDCSPQGLDCWYPEGQCNCAMTLPVSAIPRWQCATPAIGCPEPRARIGSACSQEGLSCNYGGCTGGVEESCKNGYWQRVLVLCPR